VLLSLILAGATVAGSWNPQGPLPRAVAGHAAVLAADGSFWIAGGSYWTDNRKRIEDATWSRSNGGAWVRRDPIPGGFAHGAVASDGRHAWLVGGAASEGITATVRRLDLTTGRVTALAELPEPRVYAGAAWLEGAVWVVGGTSRDGDYAALPTGVYRIDPASGGVRRLTTPGPASVNPVVLALEGELHVLPGSEWSAGRKRLESPAAAWIYSPAGDRWRQRPLAVSLPRGLSGVALSDGRALLAGGVDHTTGALARGVWRYRARDGALTPGTELPEPRLAAPLLATAQHVYLLGGEDRPRGRVDTVWRLPLP
jgi:N-acetylneuraminic acid mutarotase